MNTTGISNGSDIEPRFEPMVVSVALETARRHPRRDPLKILDAAIGPWRGRQLDFEFDDEELRPPHPFAELLRLAFAPSIPLSSLTYGRHWTHIILPFARRYQIWEPDQSAAASADVVDNVTWFPNGEHQPGRLK